MTRLLLLVVSLLMSFACQPAPTSSGFPLAPSGLFSAAPQVQHVNITGISLTRSPLKIEFTGTYEGPAAGQTLHQLTRPDLPTGAPWGPITTAVQLETYLNSFWFPQELRDVTGARMGFAMIHIISFSPTDVQWEIRLSDDPINKWW